jgi:phosphohistidine swiveling domain-containing protein
VAISDLLDVSTNPPSANLEEWLTHRIEEGRKRHTVAQAVELPPLLYGESDFLCFERPAREPNFVTGKTVRAELTEPEINTDPELDGKLVMIPQADPGYDWLFGYDIKGLITMYGGANSHMAIRAAEFGLPAAIGVGESLYEKLSSADIIELDCESETIKTIK